MLRNTNILPDTYKSGRFLRRWELVEGFPRCTQDALDTETASDEEITAVEASNRLVQETLEAVEAYEEASRILDKGMPDPWVEVHNIEGDLEEVQSPVWVSYQSALETVSTATDLTKAYATIRNGKPAEPTTDEEPSPEWTAYQDALAVISDQ